MNKNLAKAYEEVFLDLFGIAPVLPKKVTYKWFMKECHEHEQERQNEIPKKRT